MRARDRNHGIAGRSSTVEGAGRICISWQICEIERSDSDFPEFQDSSAGTASYTSISWQICEMERSDDDIPESQNPSAATASYTSRRLECLPPSCQRRI